jgi:hypothetical protein
MKEPIEEDSISLGRLLKEVATAKGRKKMNTNWQRPTLRLRGRITEDVAGADVPPEFRAAPMPQRSKADMRREADAALRTFDKRAPPQQQDQLSPASEEDAPSTVGIQQ